MITHDDARRKPKYYDTTYKLIETEFYYEYITQQEKKDKLLELYKEKDNMTGTVRYFEILSQINELEEELK
jgi:hypothetical protein